ncbi:MAG: serine/threonine protein kinase, partial [Candidatus Aminicenantes bacterium]|nr:serine/threonine protein kinase [Candidatus Aminicenantes bacterium]
MRCSKCGLEIPRDSDTCTRCGTPILRKNDTPTRRIQKDFSLNTAIYFSPGDSFGERYKVVEEIGSGGMGKIFKAFDNELGIHVAIKMIRPEILSKPDTLARFRKEILIAREITHENVVRIYDFGEVDGVKFISMQYIDGENLADLIRTSGTLSSETAISIAKQICRGIDAAHKKDIIHRDLKPQNIMIDKNGKVYITDFGLAKSLQETGLSTSGVVMGTPQYLSPEQAKGDNVDQRSDIYTLGIIMYEMITGQELFVS